MRNINVLIGDYHLNEKTILNLKSRLDNLKPKTFKKNPKLKDQLFQFQLDSKTNLFNYDFEIRPLIVIDILFEIQYIKNKTVLEKKKVNELIAPSSINDIFDTYVISICNQNEIFDKINNLNIDDHLIKRMCSKIIRNINLNQLKRFEKSKFKNVIEMIMFLKNAINNSDRDKYYKLFLINQVEKFETTLDVDYLLRANNSNIYRNISTKIISIDKLKWMFNFHFNRKD